MGHHTEPGQDPLANLLAISPEEDSRTEQSVEKAVHAAHRHVGTHDVLSLMLVNLWQVLAQMLALLFLIKQHKLKEKGDNNGKS